MLTAVACLFLVAGAPAAQADTFQFSFTNVSTSGTVTGLIEGLVDNEAGQAATQVIVTSAPSGFSPLPVDFIATSASTNSFTVANGEITSGEFSALNFSGNGFDLCLGPICSPDTFLAEGTVNNPDFVEVDSSANPTYTPDAPVATPLPATLPLFATGLGALALVGWRRKRRAKAVA